MVRKNLLSIIIMCVGISISVGDYRIHGDISGDVETFFKDAGQKITTTYDDAMNAIKRAPACAEVVTKGLEWSALQAAYYSAKGTLEVSKTLQHADPRIMALQTKITALQASLKGIDATTATGSAGVDIVSAAGKWGVKTISDLGGVVGSLLVSGINIQRAEFDVNLADVKAGKMPMVGLTGIFAGKKLDLNVQIDFKDIPKSLVNIANAIKGNI